MSNHLKVASLFAGIGGFEAGFQNSNIKSKIVFASEIDKFAVKTYSFNFPVDKMHGDITKINEKLIPDHDFLCAGFPCQTFSIAGKQKGFEDPTRGTLFFDIVRILKEKKPKFILLENVKNLVSHDSGNTIKIILESISSIGYSFDFSIINSSELGLPQNRERTYIVGFLGKATEPFENDIRNKKITDIKMWANKNKLNSINFFNSLKLAKQNSYLVDILEESVDKKYYLNSTKVLDYLNNLNIENLINDKQSKIIKEFDLPKNIHNDLERQRRVYSIYGISPTLLARSDSPKIIVQNKSNELKIRKITPIEAFKIQGFTNDFIKNIKTNYMSDTQLYKQAGNAVSPPIITCIINAMEIYYNE